MSPTPLFSIIIPTFNRSYLLARAIDSVLTQTYPLWELIIVDDGSTDDTQAVVKPYLKDLRIHYHWQENRELNGARNTGIRLSRGTYLAFLDDDDYYQKEHLTVLTNYILQKEEPIAAIRTAMHLRVGNNQLLSPPLLDTSGKHAVKALWDCPVNLLSFVFHRAIFHQYTFNEDFILAEDLHFLIRVFLSFPFLQIPEYTVVYQLQEQSRSSKYFSQKQLANKIAALRSIWEENKTLLQQHITVIDLEQKITNEYLHFAKCAFRASETSLGWYYFRKALFRRHLHHIKPYLSTLAAGLWRR